MRIFRLAVVSVGGVLAWAQVATVSAQQLSGDASQALGEVVVTGSRVITNGNDSPTPVTVVQAQELTDLQPTTLADALNQLPVFSGSRTQFSNPVGTATFGGGNASADQLNLRNLGANNTLVLFNGQRIVPTLQLGTVDVDMIPEMLIQRVDMVTGGVSAVYGSDAVAGVVNYVTDNTFNGVKVEAQAGRSRYDDDITEKAGIAGGMALFGERGHIEGSVDRYVDDGVLQRTDRPNLAFWGVPGAGSAANPYTLLNNLRSTSNTFGGLITSGALKGDTFDSNGVVTPFVNGIATGQPTVQVGGDGSYGNATLKAPEQMDQFFGRFDFDFTNTLHSHVQVMYNDKTDFQNGAGTSITNVVLSSTNPFLSAPLQAALAGATTFKLSKAFPVSELAPLRSWSEEQQTQINLGLDGKIGGYDWGVDFNYGRSALYDLEYNNLNQQHLAAALDAVINPANGQIACRVTLTNPTADPGCVPLNVFGPSAASDAALNYVTGTTAYTAVYHLYDGNAHLSGDVFSTWAGPVKAALSAEMRRLTFDTSSNATPEMLENCTGLTAAPAGNCNAVTTNFLNTFASGPTAALNVAEGALEFDAPLLKDVPLAKALDLNGAARYTAYTTSGDYWSWKVGPVWKVTPDFTIRGTYSRDIRAPTLFELFQPTSNVQLGLTDLLPSSPGYNTTYNINSLNLGNPNLKAEIGDTKTLGFVWQPAGTGFSLTSDYYHIDIKNYILQIQGFQNQYQQACYNGGGTSTTNPGSSPYCLLVRATPNALATAALNYFVNAASLQTWGDDLEASYTGRAMSRPYNLRLLASYQPHIIYTQPGNDTYDLGGVANGPTPLVASPSLRMTGLATANLTDRLTLGIAERWRNAMKMTGNTTGVYAGNVFVPNHVASVGYTDLNVIYKLSADLNTEAFLNVGNVFDKQPPPATFVINQNGPGLGFAAGDDPIGRYFTLGLRAKF